MHRFFLNNNNVIEGKVVKITGSDFNHISYSLRMDIGDQIIASDGKGFDYQLEIIYIGEKEIEAEIINKSQNFNEPDIKVTIAQAIPKKNNMDLIVQKCTEIGVNKIIPLNTKRTIVKLKGNKIEKRINRWQKISEEAAKQSKRAIIPKIGSVCELEDIIEQVDDYDLVLVPWEDEKKQGSKEILYKLDKEEIKRVMIIIGPEGGFVEDEINLLKSKGAIPITLGPRILRTETAGIVALTMILYQAGELGG
ncbi:16S rRNA (uracil(1498)-N(3))-methyltransferase [Natronospora cellulosivora (SeqCode)]